MTGGDIIPVYGMLSIWISNRFCGFFMFDPGILTSSGLKRSSQDIFGRLFSPVVLLSVGRLCAARPGKAQLQNWKPVRPAWSFKSPQKAILLKSKLCPGEETAPAAVPSTYQRWTVSSKQSAEGNEILLSLEVFSFPKNWQNTSAKKTVSLNLQWIKTEQKYKWKIKRINDKYINIFRLWQSGLRSVGGLQVTSSHSPKVNTQPLWPRGNVRGSGAEDDGIKSLEVSRYGL